LLKYQVRFAKVCVFMAEDRRRTVVAGSGQKSCPWCGGRLELQKGYPLRRLIPGDARARADAHIPEAMRTIRAWVCATPHCRFRESA
jgi:hypothetical protein